MAARARREVLESLSSRQAFDSDHAVAIDLPSKMHRRQLDDLIGRGIVHDTGDGLYWLDQSALELDEQRRRDAAKLALKIVLIALAIAIAVGAIVASRQ
jgi:hypothetical protein